MKKKLQRRCFSKKGISALALLACCAVNPLITYANEDIQESNIVQQTIIVKGIVTDQSGAPIIGATVMELGTTNGTITDFDGNFSFSVESGAQIKISYIGYKEQVFKVTSSKLLEIELREDTQALEEVVVVGFGTQKKVNLTGSVGTVNSEALSSRPVTSATQALQGLVPGLQISQNSGSLDSNPSINVRGVGTIGQGSSGGPLVLIDGMEGDLNTVNPQDIENISVLKDAAASSIYGSRAPFGVILVTTKNGKAGKISINYNNSFRWNKPINMPETMDSFTFATYFNDGCDNTPGWGRHFSEEHLQRIKDYQSGKLTSSIPANPANGKWMDGYSAGNDNVNWYDVVFKDVTFAQEHNISAQGGTKKMNYYVSLNYLGQDGLMKLGNEDMQRYNLTSKVSAQLASWARMNLSVRWMRRDYERPAALTNGLYETLGRQGWPTLPLYDPNGYYYSSPSPALALATGGTDRTQTDKNYYQLGLILEPIKDWKTNIEFNYQVESKMRHWEKLQTYNHDVNGNPYLYDSKSNVHEDAYKSNFWNTNIYTSYDKTFAEKHHTKVMAGFQAENFSHKMFGLQNSGVLIPGLPEVDLSSGMDNKGKPVTPDVNGSRAEWCTAGFFGRLNYDYDGRYLAEVNFRYDGTSRFRRDNRWIALPSFSLGWNVARENFWKPFQNVVNTLKLRGSWGLLGNQNTNNWYQTYRILGFSPSAGSWLQNGARPNTASFPGLVSTALTWEKIENYNVGVDFGMFNNRLTGSFDWYVRKTKDMVGPSPELPAVLGTSVPKTNNTDLKTSGWDLEIAWNDKLQNGLGYNVKVTLSDSKTKITNYPNNPTNSIDSYITGQEINQIWGFETVGIAKSDAEMQEHLKHVDQSNLGTNWAAGDIMYADLDGDGKISRGGKTLSDHGDLKVIGNSTPRYMFSFNLGANWKGFDVQAFFQGVMKRDYAVGSGYFYGADNNFWWSMGLTPHADYFRADENHPLGQNLDSYYARPVFGTYKNSQTQTHYLQDASYIRLKNLQVGYTLPASVVSRLGISNLRVFVSGENLWTGSSLSSLYDPETIDGGWNGCVYPLSKTFSCGLSLTF